jgi:G:T/U-mismatch repair DNA glycosylase
VDAFWQAFEPLWEREQLAATSQTVPNQLKQPIDRPTMRWIFQCFEGMSLATFQPPQGPPHRELANLEPLHARWPTRGIRWSGHH